MNKQGLKISTFVTLKNELLKLTECFKAINFCGNVSHISSALIQYSNTLKLKCIQYIKRMSSHLDMVSQTLVDEYMGFNKWTLLKVTII